VAWNIEQVQELKEYMTGVLGRSEHHAQEVSEIVFALAGAIVYYADPDSEIAVRQGRGEDSAPANQLRVSIGGNRYVLSWSHADRQIVIKERNQRGDVIQRFDNSSTNADVRKFFTSLLGAERA